MTDMTFETPRFDTAGWAARPAPRSPGARLSARRREYWAYFALVLILALPLSLAVWSLKAARTLSMPERGPLRAAWGQAAIITPIILSA